MGVQNAAREYTGSRIKEPKQYCVVMHNDDFTTMEFVVGVLIDIFHKDEVSAHSIMMSVHKSGKAVVGKYPYDMAVTRVSRALSRAKEEGFPFRMTVEEA
ncbi:MAG: ATP-dependent Clp protease adaptor ClpS [Oscillospiraceae bacterium]|nr:ATP-dependent Clp protease adaptor ClpS [Oscillospiraceae bacterium]